MYLETFSLQRKENLGTMLGPVGESVTVEGSCVTEKRHCQVQKPGFLWEGPAVLASNRERNVWHVPVLVIFIYIYIHICVYVLQFLFWYISLKAYSNLPKNWGWWGSSPKIMSSWDHFSSSCSQTPKWPFASWKDQRKAALQRWPSILSGPFSQERSQLLGSAFGNFFRWQDLGSFQGPPSSVENSSSSKIVSSLSPLRQSPFPSPFLSFSVIWKLARPWVIESAIK